MRKALAKAQEITLNNVLYNIEELTSIEVNPDEKFGIGFGFGHNLKEQLIRIDLDITINEKVHASTEYHYHIINLDRFYNKVDGVVDFDRSFISQLCGISYATLRGLLLAATTKENSLMLPIADPNHIVATHR